jgi:hypothetical protein
MLRDQAIHLFQSKVQLLVKQKLWMFSWIGLALAGQILD